MSTSPSMHRTNFSSPEVVLREPLEQDFVMNRRLANQINARQKEEAAKEARLKFQEEKKKKLDAEIKKKADDIKTREKAQYEAKNAKAEIWAAAHEKRATVAEVAFENIQKKNAKLRALDDKNQASHRAMLAAKEEARRAKQEEEFKADLLAMEKKRKAKDLEAKKSL